MLRVSVAVSDEIECSMVEADGVSCAHIVADDVFCGMAVADDTRADARVIDDIWCSVAEALGAALSVVTVSDAAVGDVSSAVIEVALSGAVLSLSGNYALGVTIRVNGASASIASATLQSGSMRIHYELSSAVDADDTISFAYSASTGDLQDGSGVEIADVPETSATNFVGGHLYFDESADAVHIASV